MDWNKFNAYSSQFSFFNTSLVSIYCSTFSGTWKENECGILFIQSSSWDISLAWTLGRAEIGGTTGGVALDRPVSRTTEGSWTLSFSPLLWYQGWRGILFPNRRQVQGASVRCQHETETLAHIHTRLSSSPSPSCPPVRISETPRLSDLEATLEDWYF